MKKIRITFEFTDEEWKALKEEYTEQEIREILKGGANGELEQLKIIKLDNK